MGQASRQELSHTVSPLFVVVVSLMRVTESISQMRKWRLRSAQGELHLKGVGPETQACLTRGAYYPPSFSFLARAKGIHASSAPSVQSRGGCILKDAQKAQVVSRSWSAPDRKRRGREEGQGRQKRTYFSSYPGQLGMSSARRPPARLSVKGKGAHFSIKHFQLALPSNLFSSSVFLTTSIVIALV